ncbi:MAG TPA: biotin/lipoate--protein ligase family protein [Geminicoccaceae bacterium]|nr:biotin/lipoate--protein ligase family protein [Geminicoccaceae bacterium]
MNAMRMADNPRTLPDLPPPFRVRWVAGDVMAAARQAAERGEEPGLLLIGEDEATCDLALALAPDRPEAACRVVLHLAMLAVADALAAVGPPLKEVVFASPDGLRLDGAKVGRVRLAMAEVAAPDEVPEWCVVGPEVRMMLPPAAGEPGAMPEVTALQEEGFGGVGVVELAQSFARHFLYWMHRWTEEGSGPVLAHWRARLDPLTIEPVL